MAVRYEGGIHGVTGVAEPDLELTDDLELIANRILAQYEHRVHGTTFVLLEGTRLIL